MTFLADFFALWHTHKHARKAKKAIRKAFENTRLKEKKDHNAQKLPIELESVMEYRYHKFLWLLAMTKYRFKITNGTSIAYDL